MTRPLPYLFAALAALLGYGAVSLAADRPILSEPAADHVCATPWETALTGNSPNITLTPGDEQAQRVADCRTVSQARFVQATGFGGASLLSLGISGVVVARRRTGLEAA